MTFLHLEWLYFAVPALLLLIGLRVWRRRFWGHSLVEHLGEETGGFNPVWRLPKLLEAAALGLLLVALLGPVYPFSVNRVERGGLQIVIVLDLSQSMEEPIEGAAGRTPSSPIIAAPPPNMLGTPGSRMEAVKKSALDFVSKRPGDAVGLVVFSTNGYLVSPASSDHESISQYLLMTGTHTLVNEGYTAIGEGLGTANRFFMQEKERAGRRAKGQVVVLFTDGENNTGRDPLTEIERAKAEGIRVYMIGVALQPGASQEIAAAIPRTGGKYYDVRTSTHLEQALTDVSDVEKGVFYTLSLTRNQPAYFVFVGLALACLAWRLILHAFPHFVEIS
ncbi:MAG: VWA domain-containing protein, partial [Acidobacteria bacterium]|nr:VWA domain-containing protein [Acidobacteriota bacterium]